VAADSHLRTAAGRLLQRLDCAPVRQHIGRHVNPPPGLDRIASLAMMATASSKRAVL
jgi:hypothetical protein